MTSCLLSQMKKTFQNGVNFVRKESAPKGADSSLTKMTPFEREEKIKMVVLLPLRVYSLTLNN